MTLTSLFGAFNGFGLFVEVGGDEVGVNGVATGLIEAIDFVGVIVGWHRAIARLEDKGCAETHQGEEEREEFAKHGSWELKVESCACKGNKKD